MSDTSIKENIERRLAELDLSANAASVRAGLPRDAIRDILTGKSQNPRADTIIKLARALDMDPGLLLIPHHSSRPRIAPTADEVILPVRYMVAAGMWREQEDYVDHEPEMMSVPPAKGFERFPQWLERVQGDSMDKIVPSGSLVHVVDAIAMHYEPRHDDIVVVERVRAQGALVERSLKQLQITEEGMSLWPRSHNTRWSKPLDLSDGSDDSDTVVQVVGLVIRAMIDFR